MGGGRAAGSDPAVLVTASSFRLPEPGPSPEPPPSEKNTIFPDPVLVRPPVQATVISGIMRVLDKRSRMGKVPAPLAKQLEMVRRTVGKEFLEFDLTLTLCAPVIKRAKKRANLTRSRALASRD